MVASAVFGAVGIKDAEEFYRVNPEKPTKRIYFINTSKSVENTSVEEPPEVTIEAKQISYTQDDKLTQLVIAAVALVIIIIAVNTYYSDKVTSRKRQKKKSK